MKRIVSLQAFFLILFSLNTQAFELVDRGNTKVNYSTESHLIDPFLLDNELQLMDSIYVETDSMYEGCDLLAIHIYRPDGDMSVSLDVEYHLAGSATLNTDYNIIGNSGPYQITFNPSQNLVILYIEALYDWDVEGAENAEFVFDLGNVDANGQSLDLVNVVIQDQPTIEVDLGEDLYSYCPGFDVELEPIVTGGIVDTDADYTYEWSHIGTAKIQIVDPLVTTEYCVEVSDICGNQIEADCVTIEVEEHPELEAESELKYLCEDIQDSLCVFVEGGEGSYSFEWSNGSTDSCIYDYHDTYEVIVTDGCEIKTITEGEIYLDEAPEPHFEYLVIPHETMGYEFNNYTPTYPAATINWDFDDGFNSQIDNPIHLYDASGLYEVTLEVVTDIAGCTKEMTQQVEVEPMFSFYAPNAFSPNNDDINDKFKAKVLGARTYELFIYDRFGKQVFTSTNPNEEWDGTYDGKPAAQGTYVYTAKMTKHTDIVYFEERGMVTLIR